MIQAKASLLIGILFVILSLLFTGVFYDRHADANLFTKYRPTFKQTFYPLFFSLPDLTTAERKKENEFYKEFLVDTNLINQNKIPIIPALLVQAALTFLLIGGFSFIEKKSVRYRQLLIHFLVCIIPTAFALLTIAMGPLFLFVTILLNPLPAVFLVIRKEKSSRTT